MFENGETQLSRDFIGGRQDYVSKNNPSTAAGSYFQGGNYGANLTSGGGLGLGGLMPSDSFDLDIMMPPDIASIDSDIRKFNFIYYQDNLLFLFRLTWSNDSNSNAK